MGKASLKGMIESVIADLTNNEPISQYALKLQWISRNLKNETFTQWLTKEVDGYGIDDHIPDYRVLKTQVQANLLIDQGFNKTHLSNHIIPLLPLGIKLAKEISTIRIIESVIVLTKLIEEKGILAYSTTEYERVKLGQIYENSTILGATKLIQRSDFELIIHKFKSALLDIFMEFNEDLIRR